jgi:hypothetical protein
MELRNCWQLKKTRRPRTKRKSGKVPAKRRRARAHGGVGFVFAIGYSIGLESGL